MPGALWRFWQPRYFDLNVSRRKSYARSWISMHMNPVRENLVSDPRDWPWSSWTFYERGEGLLRDGLVGKDAARRTS